VISKNPIGRLQRIRRLLTPDDVNRASHGERWFSALGGFIGLYGLLWINAEVLHLQGAAMVVGSMGATLVLVFAVPHGALSQPWAVFGGHLISALIGVSCAQLIADPVLAAAVAVGLAVGAMYYLHCIHPPGGATAMVAVLGGSEVQQLGYDFVFQPVLENVLIVLAMAVVVNFPLRHRRYPAVLAKPCHSEEPIAETPTITHQGLSYALSQLDSFIDISEQDLVRIYTLALHHAQAHPAGLRSGEVSEEGGEESGEESGEGGEGGEEGDVADSYRPRL
jgi:CBS domain-containing membrane protein